MQKQDSSYPAKNEIGRISKVILENTNKELRYKLQLQQWNNTTTAINWFKKIEKKNECKFMIFDLFFKKQKTIR